jgi:hypothetical protein
MMIRSKWFRLVAALVLPLLLAWGALASVASVQDEMMTVADDERGHVALLGSLPAVQGVAQPFIDQGALALLRTYPTPERYVAEAPVVYFPDGPPPDLAVHLYEVTAEATAVPNILQAIQNAAADLDVVAETDQLSWLSYLPQQFLVSGPCAAIVQTMEMAPGVFPQVMIDWEGDEQCAHNEQIWQLLIEDGARVVEKVTAVNALTHTITAQPNHLLVGASRDYIAGSPYGPFAPNAGPRQPGPQPYSGAGVQVVVYDNIPYALAVGETITSSIQGVSVTISYPAALPSDLPQGPRAVPGHGSFVASAAVALAPDADFHLVATLNETAVGDEFTWYQAMAYMLAQTRPISHTLAGSVYNYSFTLEITPTLNLTGTAALDQALWVIDDHNILQAASAGNDSAFAVAPLPMTWPAQHTVTVGVTAVIWNDSGLSCYANQGELAMWGGGIGRGQGSCPPVAILTQCASGSYPEYCVTGWDATSTTNYAYGLGTSYATPQVVALAAQGIQSQGNLPGDWPAPSLIRGYLHNLVLLNPDPINLQIGVIGNPYPDLDGQTLYLPLIMR